jgi:hypothetical protein
LKSVPELPTSLEDLVEDQRLERLFTVQGRDCAIQLWILRICDGEDIETRIVYGRLLPYNHSSNTWYSAEDEHFSPVGAYKAELVRISLYIKSTDTATLLRLLASGKNIAQISSELNLKLKQSLAKRVGVAALLHIFFRPVSYLLNRDSHTQAPLSPHGSGGALSAALCQTDKVTLLFGGLDIREALAGFVIDRLNSDTALRFDTNDTSRLGDVELLVFPTLDDSERELLNVDWQKDRLSLAVGMRTIQLPAYKTFRIRLGIYNDRQLIYSCLRTAALADAEIFSCIFEVPEQLRPIVDEAEVEVFGVRENTPSEDLCCRWRITYIRQININMQLVGSALPSVHFDWLENVTKSPAAAQRLKAALTVNRGHAASTKHVGGRHADPWVDANRAVESYLDRVHPQPSHGRFFERLSDGDGLGRLKLVEWFKDLMNRHRDHQIIIFDPFFEDAGIALVAPNASTQSEYIIFTTLPKPEPAITNPWYSTLMRLWNRLFGQKDAGVVPPGRINNLLAACERLTPLMKGVRLRIFALKHQALHDRYILVIGKDKIPVVGFQLSNSLQKANENYPLLITPIPSDTLLRVHDYCVSLLRAAFCTSADAEESSGKITLLFDSTRAPKRPLKRVEPLQFLNLAAAGKALACWTGHDSLRNLSGAQLKNQMTQLGLLQDDSLDLPSAPGLTGCLRQAACDFSDFDDEWSILSEIFANTPHDFGEIQTFSEFPAFLDFLTSFVRRSFLRTHSREVDFSTSHIAVTHFQNALASLLTSSVHLEAFWHPTKYAILSWAEFYAIDLLWTHAPDALVAITEAEAAAIPAGENEGHAVKLSLLSQIAGVISMSGRTHSTAEQRERLIKSSNGLLQWMGWSLVEEELSKPDGIRVLEFSLAGCALNLKIQILGWLIQQHARKADRTIFHRLTALLVKTLPTVLTTDQTSQVIDSLRGPVRHLSWAEPWLYQDVVEPLLADGRVSAEDLCQLWTEELMIHFNEAIEGRSQLFRRDAEGKVTETAALLFSRSSLSQQEKTLKELHKKLRAVQRDVQKPLASTLNWNRWNSSLVVAMWIHAFARWAQSMTVTPTSIDQSLSQLSDDSRSLALIRPISEWRSYLGGEAGELAAFIEEIGSL